MVLIITSQIKSYEKVSYHLLSWQHVFPFDNEHYYIDETILLLDQEADKQGILDLLQKELKNKLTIQDSILLFYAGHSKIEKHDDTGKDTGYWIPSDANKTDKKTWINNKEILKAIETRHVKHVLFIIDSCLKTPV